MFNIFSQYKSKYYYFKISYEGIFIIVLCLQMVSWLFIESFLYSGTFNIDLVNKILISQLFNLIQFIQLTIIFKAMNKKRTNYFITNNEEESENNNWVNVFRVYILVRFNLENGIRFIIILKNQSNFIQDFSFVDCIFWYWKYGIHKQVY